MDLSDAFTRLEAFRDVQLAERGEYTPDAVACLLEAAGIGDAERSMICERVPPFGDGDPGAVLLGVLLGVFAGGG